MKSAIYTGTVRHRRTLPVPHAFRYRLFMMYLDLAELDTVFAPYWLWSAKRPAPAWFRRADFLGDRSLPLDMAVRSLVETQTGARPDGPIRMLAHLRYFGYIVNPVTFYYCFDRDDQYVETVVAEITNTPWNERHAYVLGPASNEGSTTRKRFRFAKAFHVSPFMDMTHEYEWRFSDPERRLVVHMENSEHGSKLFDATLVLERRAITGASLARMLALYPLMTLKVVGGIYWQATRLWMKRAPFFVHPAKRTA